MRRERIIDKEIWRRHWRIDNRLSREGFTVDTSDKFTPSGIDTLQMKEIVLNLLHSPLL